MPSATMTASPPTRSGNCSSLYDPFPDSTHYADMRIAPVDCERISAFPGMLK